MIEFSIEVERLVKQEDMTYLEAVTHHIQKCGMSVEDFKHKSFLSEKIIEKMRDEATQLNLIGRNKKKDKKLPL